MAESRLFPPIGTDKSWLDRALSIVTEVRAGEGVSALLLAANVFFILAFYSVLKIVRDALILSEADAVVASYSAAGQALLLALFVPAYGLLASRVSRLWLVCGVTVFFASHLLVFYTLGAAGARLGVAFYLWVGVFNMVAVAQFWAFANDVYTTERGRRLFPLLGVGANLGAVVGSGTTAYLFGGIGAYRLMLVAGAGLLIPVVLTIWVHRRERHAHRDAAAEKADRPLESTGGFQLVFTNRYLMLIALMVLVFNLVNTLGGFLLNTLIRSEAFRMVELGTNNGLGEGALIGTMAGTIQTFVNVLAFLLQMFAVSRIFTYIGIRGALFVLPVIALGGYALVALFPVFAVLRVTKILENGTDYSLQNTTRQALFLPTSREAKYKAKQAIDAFFVRAGDLLQAGVVFAGTALALGVSHFAMLNVVLVLLWLGLATAIAREHKKLVPEESSQEAA